MAVTPAQEKRVRIKICGLTDPAEARAVAEAGADAVGLVFAKSPRRVQLDQARRIVEVLPPLVQAVGVFVNQEIEFIQRAVAECGLDLVQLHGEESPEMCRRLGPRVLKAWRIRSREDLDALAVYEPVVRGFLLDAWAPDAHGGTGRTFDWSVAREACARLSRPVILAGGLTPENAAQAVAVARPYGIDASSGVELAPGKKDLDRVKRLINTIRSRHGE